MKCYLVGGAVRDRLLDLPVLERDWVVVGGTEAEMLEAGFSRADAQFPVFVHPQTGEEYALARTEIKTGPGYKGFKVACGPDVTLEQDLLRRDLTINALAQDESGALIDVCHGQDDLHEGLLRHITPAFCEDPVRLLRIARFAAKLGKWGFRVAHGTYGLLKKMAASDDLLNLKPERVWREMQKAITEPEPWRFFEVLQRCGALGRLVPEFQQVMGEGTGHAAKASTEALVALRRAAALTQSPQVRLAVVLYLPARLAADAEQFMRRLTLDRVVAERVRDLLILSPRLLGACQAEDLLAVVYRLKPGRQKQRYMDFLLACRALWPEIETQSLGRTLELARQAIEAVETADLRAQGLAGAALGAALRQQQIEWLSARLRQLSEEPKPPAEESC